MNIVVLDASTLNKDERLDELKKYGSLTIYDYTMPEDTVERSKGADIILTNKVVFGKTELDLLDNLKLICITATGMNNVDLDYAASKGISVKNVAGYSTKSVAQVTFSMLLHLMSNISNYDSYVKSKDYVLSPIFTNLQKGFEEISGKKWGIVGLGNIGKEVAKIANAFGAEVSYYSTSGVERKEDYPRKDLDTLLAESDIITLHSPLTPQTENLISLKELEKMKRSAILINVARGGIVNEADLVEALNTNLIAATGVDVFTKEPIVKDSPYFEIKDNSKIVFAPHIAWASSEARETLIDKLISNIETFLSK